MPLVMQFWNIFRGRAIGHWLQESGISIIPNVRWGDERTYEACCLGVPKNSIIAVGSHGCIKLLEEKRQFAKGLDHVVRRLGPKTIVVYGTVPESIFGKYKASGIRVLKFESDYMVAHRKEGGD